MIDDISTHRDSTHRDELRDLRLSVHVRPLCPLGPVIERPVTATRPPRCRPQACRLPGVRAKAQPTIR